uniref:Cysteine protease n=2 Tax=Drosera adelae TaxID=173387 RepID=A0A1L7NZT0_9CARY|nr:cysteine protease [Drosera adelae]
MAFTNTFHQFLLFAILLCIGLSSFQSSAISHEPSMVKRHEEWMVQHRRTYKDNVEKERRFQIFQKNVNLIEAHNKKNKSYSLSVNQFADLTDEEFEKMYASAKVPESRHSNSQRTPFKYEGYTSVPASINWVTMGAVTPIRNQGTCGSCWAFAAIATVESLTWIKTGKSYDLSEQQIVDCDRYGKDRGCNGGYADGAYNWIINNRGVTTEASYPYVGYQQYYCYRAQSAVTIKGYQFVPNNSERAMQQAVANQPIAVYVESKGYNFKYYSGGLFTGQCGTATDHVVAVVGYGTTTDGYPYWLIKNSWGTGWGENGYMRMLRNVNDPRGLCGIALYPTYPTN